MSTLITISFALCFIALTGWMITTYLVKEDSQQFIQEEVKNLFNICKMFFVSIKNLIRILAKYSFSSDLSATRQIESDEHPLSLVQSAPKIAVQSFKVPLEEDHDTALSSFSPEVVEVITEEEEKVA